MLLYADDAISFSAVYYQQYVKYANLKSSRKAQLTANLTNLCKSAYSKKATNGMAVQHRIRTICGSSFGLNNTKSPCDSDKKLSQLKERMAVLRGGINTRLRTKTVGVKKNDRSRHQLF